MPEIVPLARHHDRTRFDCGVPELNSFLKATARQHGDKGISRTFVLSDQEKPETILGYFTLTLCEVRTEYLPATYAKKYPQHGLPAVRLARLAVSRKYQRKGYGGLLLAAALAEAKRLGLTQLTTEASAFSYGLFLRYGFELTGLESVERGGVGFIRYRLHCRLPS